MEIFVFDSGSIELFIGMVLVTLAGFIAGVNYARNELKNGENGESGEVE